MTRQRIRPSLKRSVYKDCPGCTGTGVVKTAESMAIEVMRLLILAAQREDVARISVTVYDEVATYLNNKKRREIARLEDDGQDGRAGRTAARTFRRSTSSIECHDAQGREVKFNI